MNPTDKAAIEGLIAFIESDTRVNGDVALTECRRALPALQRLLAGETREAVAAERLEHVHITDKQAVVTGDPADLPDSVPDDDPRRHNCDAMGCPTLDHVLYRLPFTDRRKPVDIKALAKDLAESIDFTSGPVQARELFNKKLAVTSLYSSPPPHDDAGAMHALLKDLCELQRYELSVTRSEGSDWQWQQEWNIDDDGDSIMADELDAVIRKHTSEDPHHG